MSKILITGIAGQCGSYLAEHHLALGNEVHGIIRRHSVAEEQTSRLSHIFDRITLHYGDLLDYGSLINVIRNVHPDEIYNLGAQSHVRIGSDVPTFTAEVNAIGTLNLLEAYRIFCPTARYYQASSSEMFGLSVDEDGFQRETTPMNPVSVYAISKVFGYHMVRHYRRAYNLHACNGILFNNESPRRGSNFVTQKVVKGAVAIYRGKANTLELGNLDAYRDWGHSKDYMRAIMMILNHNKADDFVVATGETHSVREMCQVVFEYLGLDYKLCVVQNPKFFRSEELPFLKGDASKIKETLGWKPEYTFTSLMDEMVEAELDRTL